MINYYSEDELNKVSKQRKSVKTAFFIVLAFYVLASIGIFIWYRFLPYKSSVIITVKLVEYSLSVAFVLFSFLFMGIKYRRVNRFYKLYYNLKTGKRETSEGNFFEYDESKQDKDGVDMKALIFLEWNKYKKDYFERKVLVFYEKPFPEFKENAFVRYLTQGNVLIGYEILD